MDWYPFLRPIFRRLPSSVSGIQDQIVYLKDLEQKLWMDLLKDARKNISDGKMNPSESLFFLRACYIILNHLQASAETCCLARYPGRTASKTLRSPSMPATLGEVQRLWPPPARN